MKGLIIVALALALSACTLVPMRHWYISHAVAPPPGDSREWHSCRRPGTSCPENWACTNHGCEWCDADHQPDTKCDLGND